MLLLDFVVMLREIFGKNFFFEVEDGEVVDGFEGVFVLFVFGDVSMVDVVLVEVLVDLVGSVFDGEIVLNLDDGSGDCDLWLVDGGLG